MTEENALQIDRTSEVTIFHEKALWLGVMDTERERWLQERTKLVTASGMAALLGLHPRLDALGLYAEMVTRRAAEEQAVGVDSFLFWGKKLETAITMAASEALGLQCKMSGALLVSREHPHIGATLDAEILCQKRPWECKTTASWRHRDWNEEEGKAPDHVLIQAQSQLLVTGADVCVVGCLLGGQRFVKIEVPTNDELQGMMVESSLDFMEKVRSLSPPPPTFKSHEAIQMLYPEDNGDVVALTDECAQWVAEYQEIGEEIKRLETRKTELRNLIACTIGDATYGVMPFEVGGKGVLKFALESRDEHVVRASSTRVLRQMKKLPKGIG